VLAAVDRAERHWPGVGDGPGAAMAQIVKHLGFVGNPWTTRQLRPELDGLVAQGLLTASRRHGRTYWAPTKTGRRRLAGLRRAGRTPELPESPQHRAWRVARADAAAQIDTFRTELGRELEKATTLLARGRRVDSDAWFDLCQRLSRRCWRVGSATHCLYEWKEPDDAKADVDAGRDPGDERLGRAARERLRELRSGRRNHRLWAPSDDEDALVAEKLPAKIITVPAELVGYLHCGLYNELTVPAEGLIEESSRAEPSPEQYRKHFEYLDDVCALLDLIGWAKPSQPAAIVIDLRANRRAVTAALDYAVRGSGDELEDQDNQDDRKRSQATAQVPGVSKGRFCCRGGAHFPR
jgi:DNA-binding PadR family transcriptional regulator